ncbi:MFS transporter [Nonomuraea diastatica]|uniref:MFS transporter n=1 Tax=Nonomuraea diastatica TaxID=1848329 RepID=UPI0015F2DB7B|nr:MFS transporter [Nonomuraea diastatica]
MQTLIIPLVPQLPALLGTTASDATWAITATLLAGAVATPVVGRLGDMYGKRRMLLVSLALLAAVVAAGYGLSVVLMSAIWHLVLVSAVIGAGIGIAYGAMPALIMAAVPVSETAAANSLNTLMRSIGTSVSSAVAGVVLAQPTVTFGALTVPSENGFRLVMAIGSGAVLVALMIAAFLPGHRRSGASMATSRMPTGAPAEAPGGG